MRTHGHRAAKIDPLDLIHREEVAALFPQRYGLFDYAELFNVSGILWTRRLGDPGEGELWSLKQIEDHLRKIYIGNIAYEVRFIPAYFKFNAHGAKFMHSPSKTERLWFSHLLESHTLPSPEDTPLLNVDEEVKRRIHGLLARSEVLDNFLQLKFPNLKRVRMFRLCTRTDKLTLLHSTD